MPTFITHAVVAAAAVYVCPLEEKPPRLWALAIGCSVLPDADVVGFGFGIQYEDLLGHRGLSHSICFAALLAFVIAVTAFREANRKKLYAFFFLLTASHGFLDAFTDGGLGIAFFSPFDTSRYFFPFQPLRVSPIGLYDFLTPYGAAVLGSEFSWVMLPCGVVMLARSIFRLRQRL